MKGSIKDLYKEVILENSRNPANEGIIADANLSFTAYNPLCGDKYTFHLKIENEKVTDASFTGFGCAISKASSSILMKKTVGLTLTEIKKRVGEFLNMINPEVNLDTEKVEDEELLAFTEARNFPERIPCASLGWEEIKRNI